MTILEQPCQKPGSYTAQLSPYQSASLPLVIVRGMLQADICQLGMDQRKVNVLAREYCDECRPKRKLKPIILSHHMMPGLLAVSAAPSPLQDLMSLHQLLTYVMPGCRARAFVKTVLAACSPYEASHPSNSVSYCKCAGHSNELHPTSQVQLDCFWPSSEASPYACVQGQEKMSKSDPNSAIFMEDTEAEVGSALHCLRLRQMLLTCRNPSMNVKPNQDVAGSLAMCEHVPTVCVKCRQVNSKIKKAFCPPGVVDGNPVIVYIEHIVLPWTGRVDVERPDSAGGNRRAHDLCLRRAAGIAERCSHMRRDRLPRSILSVANSSGPLPSSCPVS